MPDTKQGKGMAKTITGERLPQQDPIYLSDKLALDDAEELANVKNSIKEALQKLNPKWSKTKIEQETKNAMNGIVKEAIRDMKYEILALKKLYKNTHGSNWRKKEWDFSKPLSELDSAAVKLEYIEVAKNATIPLMSNRVVELHLGRRYMDPYFANSADDSGETSITKKRNGEIPKEIMHLKKLRVLNMSFNFLVGGIPEEIGDLTELQTLRLEFNHLHGNLPSELGKLKKLTEVALDHNRLEGNIDVFAGMSKLKKLNIHENKFWGNVPEQLANLSSLNRFWFYRNFLIVQKNSKIEKRVDGTKWKAKEEGEGNYKVVSA